MPRRLRLLALGAALLAPSVGAASTDILRSACGQLSSPAASAFRAYMAQYNKTYSTAELVDRCVYYSRFVSNLPKYNQKFGGGLMVTEEADWSPAEVDRRYGSGKFLQTLADFSERLAPVDALWATYNASEEPAELGSLPLDDDATVSRQLQAWAPGAPLRASIDWSSHDNPLGSPATWGTKSQEKCGGCWTFAVNSVLEAAITIATGGSKRNVCGVTVLPALYCAGGGCSGGDPLTALKFAQTYGIIQGSRKYGWQRGFNANPSNGQCQAMLNDPVYNQFRCSAPENVGCVSACEGERPLMEALMYGPIAVAVAWNNHEWQGFQGDAIRGNPTRAGPFPGADPSIETCVEKINHAVMLVGYGVRNGVPYWKVQNSWGSGFGDGGFAYIKRNPTGCQPYCMGAYPIYVRGALLRPKLRDLQTRTRFDADGKCAAWKIRAGDICEEGGRVCTMSMTMSAADDDVVEAPHEQQGTSMKLITIAAAVGGAVAVAAAMVLVAFKKGLLGKFRNKEGDSDIINPMIVELEMVDRE